MKRTAKWIKLTIVFIVMSSIAMLPFFIKNNIISGVDLTFHLNRIINLSKTMQNGRIFSFISTWGLNGIGVPINMVYGCLPLYPFAFLFVILHHKIYAYYLGIVFWLVISNIISYIFGYKYYKSTKKAFLFSTIYSFANYLFGNFFEIGDIGQAVAWIFMPMLVWGCFNTFIQEGNKKEWYFVPIAMSAIVYSHIISTLIAISIVGIFVLYAILQKNDTLHKINVLIIQIIFTIGMTLFYWVNLIAVLKNSPNIPQCSELSGINVSDFIQQQFTWGGNRIGSLIAILFVIGLCNWNKLDKYAHMSAIVAIIYSFLMTNISTVFLTIISHTPFRMIQWTGRLAGAVNLFSIIFAVDVISLILKNTGWKKWGYAGVISIFILGFTGQGIIFTKTPNLKTIDHVATTKNPLPFDHWKIRSNNELDFISSKNYTGVGYLDYWPSKSKKFSKHIIDNETNINGTYKNIKIIKKVDKFILDGSLIQKNDVVDTPILYGNYFKVCQNNKTLKYIESQQGTVEFKAIQSRHPIIIEYITPIITKIACIISFTIGIILLLIIIRY